MRRATARQVGRALLVALPALVLPFLIRAAVVEGVATATEVSTIGIGYSAAAGLLIYRRFEWGRLYPMLVETACLSGAILLIIGTATGMAWALTQSGFSRALAGAMAGVPGGAAGFMAISVVPRSSCWAASWRAFRPSCCSVRCCSPSRGRWGSTTCIMRWWWC